jgi:hypothetical protein
MLLQLTVLDCYLHESSLLLIQLQLQPQLQPQLLNATTLCLLLASDTATHQSLAAPRAAAAVA